MMMDDRLGKLVGVQRRKHFGVYNKHLHFLVQVRV
jgi:hypothetical protein